MLKSGARPSTCIHTITYDFVHFPCYLPPSTSGAIDLRMDKLNSQLYWQNCCIIQENERLRRKAEQLNQENQTLLSELKKKLSSNHNHDSDTCLTSNAASTSNQIKKP